jgi:hypothetical protein
VTLKQNRGGGGGSSSGGSGPWGINVSAGELLGRTHEELVLLLIQLRRQSAGVCKAMETCHVEIEAQVCLVGRGSSGCQLCGGGFWCTVLVICNGSNNFLKWSICISIKQMPSWPSRIGCSLKPRDPL